MWAGDERCALALSFECIALGTLGSNTGHSPITPVTCTLFSLLRSRLVRIKARTAIPRVGRNAMAKSGRVEHQRKI